MLKKIRCNVCGADDYRIVYKIHPEDTGPGTDGYKITDAKRGIPLRIVKCQKCGLIYANPRPPVRTLIHNYINMVDEVYVEEEAGRRLSARFILNTLKKLRKRGRLLDIGCATGFLLDEARNGGWDVYGIELSNWAVNYAKNKLGLKNIFHGVLKNAAYPDNYFDAVIMKDSLEHITDPKNTLREIRRTLKADGVLCISVPDTGSFISRLLKARWWGVNQSHLYYFTRKTLYSLLEASGFKPVKLKSHARVFSLKYWSARLKSYNNTVYEILALLIKSGIIRNNLLRIDFKDQIEVYAKKSHKLKYLADLERPPHRSTGKKMKVIAVLPAYNAAKTLKRTVEDIPEGCVDDIILVDDASSDNTARTAKSMALKVFTHRANKGYGANQKTCYSKALEEGADIVVMLHPDYQYDPKSIPHLIEPIKNGRADAVFGSRMMKGGALEGGMPAWKHSANIMLTALENITFGTFLTEYHSGFRAYSARVLKTVKFQLNNDGFIFDTEIIAQMLLHNFKIEEIPIRTRYFDEASTIKFLPCLIYGLGIIKTLFKYLIHKYTFFKFRQFD